MSADIAATGNVQNLRPSVPAEGAAVQHQVQKPAQQQPSLQRATREQARDAQQAIMEKAKRASEQLNDVMNTFDRGLRFRVHEDTERTYVEVINRRTEEVVRTFPPEELLDVMARLHDVLGMILDTEG